jgi:hypothetical protein
MILLLGKNGYVSSRFQDFFKYKKVDYSVESLREYTSQSRRIDPARVFYCRHRAERKWQEQSYQRHLVSSIG